MTSAVAGKFSEWSGTSRDWSRLLRSTTILRLEFVFQTVCKMAEWEFVAEVSAVPSGGRVSVIVDETPALLLRAGDDFYCIEDICSHDGQPLTDGPVEEGGIVCPRHGARFDLRTGAPVRMPATQAIRVFQVQVQEGRVFARP